MSNAVVVKPAAPLQPTSSEASHWTPEQFQLIKSTIARNATNDELQLFLYRSRMLGLDPLKPGQIHFIKYGTNPGTVVIGIDGFRSKAARTGKLQGIKRGVIRVDGKLEGAWAEVTREGWTHPAREEVSFAEYTTDKNNWADMPETMIKKVAEAAALRMAFPDELSGLYAAEEMEKQADRLPLVVPEQPMEGDGIEASPESDYLIPGGQYVKRRFREVDLKELRDYITRRDPYYEQNPTKKPTWWDDFVTRAEGYIADIELNV